MVVIHVKKLVSVLFTYQFLSITTLTNVSRVVGVAVNALTNVGLFHHVPMNVLCRIDFKISEDISAF